MGTLICLLNRIQFLQEYIVKMFDDKNFFNKEILNDPLFRYALLIMTLFIIENMNKNIKKYHLGHQFYKKGVAYTNAVPPKHEKAIKEFK